MRRVWLMVGVSVALAAGCSSGSDDAAPDSSATTVAADPAATVGTGTTAKKVTTTSTRPKPSTTVPASSTTVAPTTTRPGTATTSTTRAPGGGTTSTTRAAPPSSTPTALNCAAVGFGGPGSDQATGITATGVSCADAASLVTAVAASHNFYDGPRSFTSGAWSCSVVTDTSGLPKGFYSCTSGGHTVVWTKT